MEGTWSTEVIDGQSASVCEPIGRPRFGVLYLHGHTPASLTGQPALTEALAELRLACVALSGGDSWWTDRPCPSFHSQRTAERFLLDQVAPFFQRKWGIAPPAIGLLGTSMGGQGALRLALKHPMLFPAVAAISPAIEYQVLHGQGTPLDEMYESKEHCRQDTVGLHVSPLKYPPHIFFCIDPEDDLWFRGSDRLHEKLSALGIAHESDLKTTGGGHSGEYFGRQAGRALRFLFAGLELESRRLL